MSKKREHSKKKFTEEDKKFKRTAWKQEEAQIWGSTRRLRASREEQK